MHIKNKIHVPKLMVIKLLKLFYFSYSELLQWKLVENWHKDLQFNLFVVKAKFSFDNLVMAQYIISVTVAIYWEIRKTTTQT